MTLAILSIIVLVAILSIGISIEINSKEIDAKIKNVAEANTKLFRDNYENWYRIKSHFDQKYNEFFNTYELDTNKQNNFIFKMFASIQQIENKVESSLEKMTNLLSQKDVENISSPSVPKIKRAYVKKAKKVEVEEITPVNKEPEKVEEKPNVNRRKKRNTTNNISMG